MATQTVYRMFTPCREGECGDCAAVLHEQERRVLCGCDCHTDPDQTDDYDDYVA